MCGLVIARFAAAEYPPSRVERSFRMSFWGEATGMFGSSSIKVRSTFVVALARDSRLEGDLSEPGLTVGRGGSLPEWWR